MDVSERLKSGFGFNVYEAIFFGIIFFFVVLLWNDKWQRRRFEKLAAKLAGAKDYPIVGNGLKFIGSPEQVFKSIIKIHHEYCSEPLVKMWLGSVFLVSITKPVDIQVILNSSKVLKKSFVYEFFKHGGYDGLLTATAEKWRRIHRLVAPVFKNNQNEFLDVFNKKNEILVEKLKTEINKTQPFDLWKHILIHNLSILCQNAMNYNIDVDQTDEADEFIVAVTKVLEWDTMRIMKPWLHPDIIFSIYTNLTGKAKFFKILKKFPRKLIQEKKSAHVHRKEVEQSNRDIVTNDRCKHNKSFLDMLLELNKAGEQITDTDVEDEVIGFMIAGTETTAVTVCSCLLLLAMHQHIQEQVYDEIYKVFGDSKEIITMDKVFNLVYLEQVIKETLRIYPTVPFFARETQDDLKLVSSNLVLPKGTTCLFSPYVIHRLPELYPNPLSFNPENFSAENIAKRHKYSFIPFSAGPRNCVGSKYAMLSMKAQLVSVLRNYSVHTSLKMSEVRLEWKMLIRHATGYPVTIQPRKRMSSHREP